MEIKIGDEMILDDLEPFQHSLDLKTHELTVTIDRSRPFEENFELGLHAISDGIAELFELQSGNDFTPLLGASTQRLRMTHLLRALPALSDEEKASIRAGIGYIEPVGLVTAVDPITLAHALEKKETEDAAESLTPGEDVSHEMPVIDEDEASNPERQNGQNCQRPASELPVDARPFAKLLRQVPPWGTGASDPENPIKNKAVVGRFAPVRRTDRQDKPFKERPLLVRHQVSCQAGLHRRYQLDDVDAPAPAAVAMLLVGQPIGKGAFTMTITTIGLDLAKSVFQAHGVDESGATVLVKKLHRKQMLPFFSKLPPCLIAMEACGTAHYWARTLAAMGHEVRLIPPSYVKAYVKRGKSDALDAEAICEAVQRPTMRFVPVKTVEQQAILMSHRARSLLVRQRTMLANALRAHLAEMGHVANPGIGNLAKLAEQMMADRSALPSYARTALEIMVRRIMAVSSEIAELDQQLATWHAESEASRRLAAIPGLGIITATAIAATVTDARQFSSGRQFAAWLGLTPQQHSTGRKTRLGGISKQGDRYLRRLLVVGATAVMRHVKDKPTPMADWIRKLSEKKPFRLVSVALANKLARIAWGVLTRKEAYNPYAHLT